MKSFAWICIFVGVVNLLCGKMLPGFSFFILGLLIFIYNLLSIKTELSDHKTNNVITGNNNSMHRMVDKINLSDIGYESMIVEKIIGADFSKWEPRDVQETVESFKRWAINQECNLKDVKNNFLKNFNEVFKNDNISDIIAYLETRKIGEEASMFNIKQRNTCTHYMLVWLKDINGNNMVNQREKQFGDYNKKIKIRNKMSGKELVLKEKSTIDILRNPVNGKLYFECGGKKGMVSPRIAKNIRNLCIDEILYAEIAPIDSEKWIPSIYINLNYSKTIGEDILSSDKNKPIENDEDLPF